MYSARNDLPEIFRFRGALILQLQSPKRTAVQAFPASASFANLAKAKIRPHSNDRLFHVSYQHLQCLIPSLQCIHTDS
jgi:hypothetical protein